MQYGIDAMLTYHYLVSEYLATSDEAPDVFQKLPKNEQADRVWQGLFVKASPISEQCRSVLSTLCALGLGEQVGARDLEAIRSWYSGQDAEMFNEKMMRLARLRYVVTSHDPFALQEAAACLSPPPSLPRYRQAISLDKLFEGNWDAVCQSLAEAGLTPTLRSISELLRRCVWVLEAIFFTAATPHSFHYQAHSEPAQDSAEKMLDEVIGEVWRPSPQQVLDYVVLPFCRESNMPLSLRMGTRRSVNPTLGLAGDAMGPAQLDSLGRLCLAQPKIKFLVTVLGRGDQHEVAILASRFRNLHLWGCWWYCNNPSVVSGVTALRLEMLGTGFTFQASSARVHDQLIGKWVHSRVLLAQALTAKYSALMNTGWRVSRVDIRRDVQRLLGGAYEEFMAKVL